MARTKQTARKSTGGKAPRKQKKQAYSDEEEEDENDYDEDATKVETVVKQDFIDFAEKEEFAISDNKEQVLAKLDPESPEFHFFSAIHLLSDKKAFVEDLAAHKKLIQSHITALEAIRPAPTGLSGRISQLKHRLNLTLYDVSKEPEDKKQILDYLKTQIHLSVPRAAHFDSGSESTSTSASSQPPHEVIESMLLQKLEDNLREVKTGVNWERGFTPVALNWLSGKLLTQLTSEGGITNNNTNTKTDANNNNNNNTKIAKKKTLLFDSESEEEMEQEEEQRDEEELSDVSSDASDSGEEDKLFAPKSNNKEFSPTATPTGSALQTTILSQLLSKIYTPGVEGLVDLIVLDLQSTKTQKTKKGPPQYKFGNYTAHTVLTYEQLLEIKKKCPGIENNECYIREIVKRVLGNASFLWHADVINKQSQQCAPRPQQQQQQQQQQYKSNNKQSNIFDDDDDCDYSDDEEEDWNDSSTSSSGENAGWRSYTHIPTIPSFLTSSTAGNHDDNTLYFITNDEADKTAKRNLMEELWKLATEFVGDELLDTKAYLMYQVLKYAWHHNEAKQQLHRFIQYLSLPRKHGNQFPYSIAASSSSSTLVGINHSNVSFPPLPAVSGDHALVRAYLLMFCQQQGEKSLPLFEHCVHQHYLRHVLAEAMITAGPSDAEDHSKWYTMLNSAAEQYVQAHKGQGASTSNELSWLKAIKELGFGPTNAILHTPDEEISLDLVLKNIPQLMVQVYEIDVVAFFAAQANGTRFKDIRSDINLDGLKPNFEKKIDFSSVNSLQRHTYTVKFPEIVKGTRGVYAIEIVGGGLSCRTIIKRGFVNFTQKITPNGQVFTLFDEKGRKIQDRKLSVTVLNTGASFHAEADGTVTVPFRAKRENLVNVHPVDQAISITVDNFAVLSHFPQFEENYKLTAGWFIDDEQLNPRAGIVSAGNWSKLLVRPRLYLCGTLAPLSLLKNVNLVMTTHLEGGVQVVKECKGLEMVVNGEWVYQFQIKRDEVKLEFSLTAEVARGNAIPKLGEENAKAIELSDNTSFPISFIPSSMAIESFHLACEPTEADVTKGAKLGNLSDAIYVLYLLGRGGEPRPGRRVTVHLTHCFLQSNFTVELETDQKGRIPLGHMRGFTKVNGVVKSGDTIQSNAFDLDSNYHSSLLPIATNSVFDLNYTQTASNWWYFPHKFPSYVFHGTALRKFHIAWRQIPAVPAQVTREHVSLYSVIPQREVIGGEQQLNTYLKDYFEKVAYRDDLQMLEISGLPAGEYVLWKKFPYMAAVIIRIGTPLGASPTPGGPSTERYLLGVGGDVFLPTHPIPLQITSVQLSTSNVLTVKTTGKQKKVRVHLVFRRFLPSTYTPGLCLSRPYTPIPRYSIPSRVFSRFLSTRSTNPEYQYILNRRGFEQHYLGNSLPFPTLLIQPTPYANVNIAKKEQKRANAATSSDTATSMAPNFSKPMLRQLHQNQDLNWNQAVTNASFLANASTTLSNISLDENGVATIDSKVVADILSKYGVVEVCVVGDNGDATDEHDAEEIVSQSFWLGSSGITCRDMRLNKSEALNPSDHLCEQRASLVILPGQELTLPTTVNFSMEIYDNLSKVYNVLDTLTHNSMLFVSELQQWPYKSHEKKLEILSKSLLSTDQWTWATELYFFTYHKDRPFFDSVVRPYLSNKREKRFIELWMLEKDLSAFKIISEFQKLNTVEQILLGIRFKDMRPQITKYLSTKLSAPLSKSTQYHQIFNTALMSGDNSILGGTPPKLHRYIPGTAMSIYETPSIVLDNVGQTVAAGKKRDQDRAYKQMDQPSYLRDASYYCDTNKIPVNEFWIDFAKYVEKRDDNNSAFLSPNFLQAVDSFTEIMFALSVLDIPFEQLPTAAGTPSTTQQTAAPISYTSVAQVGQNITIKASPAGGAIVFYKDIRQAKLGDQPVGLVTTQAFFNPREKLNPDGSLKAIKDSEEFLVMQAWGCRMSVINTAGCPLPLVSVLLQVPEGAIPLGGERAFYTRNLDLDFAADETETIDYYFYFPAPGSFSHFPLHVACDNEIIACAAPRTLAVIERPRGVDTSSWDSVGRLGSDAEVIAFLHQARKLSNLSLDNVTARIMSKTGEARQKLYSQVVSVFRDRLVYSDTLWAIGYVLEDEKSICELLASRHDFVKSCGPNLDTTLINTRLRPIRFDYHEYTPYIHPRIHNAESNSQEASEEQSTQTSYSRGKGGKGLGKGYTVKQKKKELFTDADRDRRSYNSYNNNSFSNNSNIGSSSTKEVADASICYPAEFQVAYSALIEYLLFTKRPSRSDLAHICFFHLRTNRIADARSLFATIQSFMDDSDDSELTLQLDYLAAYLDVFGEAHTTSTGLQMDTAKRMVEKYKNYPILHWREMFKKISDLLARSAPLTTEAITQQVLSHGSAESGGVVQQGGGLHIASARLELDVAGNSLAITWHPGKVCADATKEVQVYYYAMDIEVIFSRDPFADQNRISPHLLVNRPTVEQTIQLPAPSNPLTVTHEAAPYARQTDIPAHLVGLPLVVQVRDPATDLECTRTYLGSSALVVHAIQQEGCLQVYEKVSSKQGDPPAKRPRVEETHSQDVFQPLGGCYVKVFRRSNNGVGFYKDGYTDVAGRFDYVARTDTPRGLADISAFAVLVLAPNKGAVKLLVSPPIM